MTTLFDVTGRAFALVTGKESAEPSLTAVHFFPSSESNAVKPLPLKQHSLHGLFFIKPSVKNGGELQV